MILLGVSSIMIARAAQSNVSIFCKDGLLPLNEVATMYIKKVRLPNQLIIVYIYFTLKNHNIYRYFYYCEGYDDKKSFSKYKIHDLTNVC